MTRHSLTLITACVVGAWLPDVVGAATVIPASRAIAAPVIDGQLTDDCWKAAKLVTGFKQYNSKVTARFQSTGYIAYDDTSLFIGVRCEEPEPGNIKTKVRPHDASVFSDDVVEIMLDPGASKTNYFQFAINASGSTFDCSRTASGASEDDEWDSDMKAAAFIGSDYWSVELAIPYYSLGITSKVGSTWGINLCREKPNPSELSTIADDSVFNNARTFARLTGLNVDFRDYSVLIGATRVNAEYAKGGLTTEVAVPVRNDTGKHRQLRIEEHMADASGNLTEETVSLSLTNDAQKLLPLKPLSLKPLISDNTDAYAILSLPRTKRLVISDAATGKILKTCNLQYPKRVRALEVKVLQPAPGERLTALVPAGKIGIELTAGFTDSTLEQGALSFEILGEGGVRIMDSSRIRFLGAHEVIAFAPEKLPSGRLTVHYMFHGPDDALVAETRRSFVNLPGATDTVRPLNNLVSELLNVSPQSAGSTFDFVNHRDGWVFFSSTAADPKGGGTMQVNLIRGTSREAVIEYQAGAAQTQEAMRWLPAGHYMLNVEGADRPSLANIIVRAIPELIYCKFPSNPQVTGHGLFDWSFLQKHLLPNINCIVGTGAPEHRPFVEQWKKEGKKWIVECPLPGLATDTITADEAYKAWSENPGYADPSLDGVIVDEFGGGDILKYEAWTEGLRRLIANEKFRDKSFYPYCGALYGSEASRTFAEIVIGANFRFAWEQYLKEQPNEKAAKQFLDYGLKQGMIGWRNGLPGSENNAIVCFGYLCAPPESCNTDASVDYKVWMDMQYNMLANDPAFRGLYGVMEYTSPYADEEALRWQGRLYRHYFIEGKKTMLSKELGFRYQLTHVKNPDFNDGTKGWTVAPAEEGSIGTNHLDGFGWLEGRYPRTSEGDDFLLMKRSASKPNTVSQEIKNLKPGRLYSLKMFTADYGDLTAGNSVRQKHAVSINIENAEMVPTNCFQEVMAHCYAHDLGPFNVNNRAWFNYHWKVFRAKGKTARLVISDWISNIESGGPIGQELMMNFVEVQPYLED